MVEQKHLGGFVKENPPETALPKEFVRNVTESKPEKTEIDTSTES